MAIMMIMEWDGVTPADYDRVRALVNWEGNVPPGALYHVAAYDGQKLRITDTWDSAEQFQAFVDQRLMAGVKQAGVNVEPKVEVLPVHAIFAPGYTAKR